MKMILMFLVLIFEGLSFFPSNVKYSAESLTCSITNTQMILLFSLTCIDLPIQILIEQLL